MKLGFSLIELLACIAVIAILAGLLLPPISGAKNRARQTQCLSNLKQINAALHLYTDDSNDFAPLTPDPSDPMRAFTGFKPLLEKYLLSHATSFEGRLFDCPADRFHFADFTSPKLVKHGLSRESSSNFSSYGFNGGNATGLPNGRGIAGLKIAGIKAPDRTPLALELSAFIPWSWHKPRQPLSGSNALFNDALNTVSFLDGHVTAIKIFWNGNPNSFAVQQEPPSGYAYQWSDY
jgi:prepilin-type N-terminal cleavage/methylation domain-containing protein